MDLSVLQKGLDLKTGKIIPPKAMEGERVVELEVSKIKPDPQQPRKTFDSVKLQELAEDIKQNGLIQPIIVRMSGVGEYVVIAGERRLKAVQMLNQPKIKAIIAKDYSNEQVGYIQMAENMKRDDLRFYEMAEFIIGRIDAGEKQSTVADKLGMSKSQVNLYMTWKEAPDFLKEAKDKFNSIRTFADIISLAKEYPDEVKDFLKDKEDFVTRSNVRDLRKSIEEPETPSAETVEETAAVDTDKVQLQEEKRSAETDEVAQEEFKETSAVADNNAGLAEEEPQAEIFDKADESETENVESLSEDVKAENAEEAETFAELGNENSSGTDNVVDAAAEDFSGLEDVTDETKHERYKKPLILGSVDGREAELLYREIPSADGMVKVKYEDGFEDEVLAEKFLLNRICEA